MSGLRGKCLIIGEASVGKTSLLDRYVNDNFQEDYVQTIGANFMVKEVDLMDKIEGITDSDNLKDVKELKIYWWDIGGQQDRLFATEYYFSQAVGALVVFDVSNEESFKSLDFWIQKMTSLTGDIPFVIIGNKCDKKKVVSEDEIKKKVSKYNVEYFETSAKTNENVTLAFNTLALKILSIRIK
ncbi:MAG: Rab family GTPase [Promethearchaeota archaeon]